ncbi:uncharacterized protein LOC144768536 isoform X6 [Lissotriton helveticus]
MAPMSGGHVALLLLLSLAVQHSVAWLWVSTGSPLVSVCPNDSALLRCIFNMDTPSMEIGHLIVIWRIGKRKVLTYENVLTVYRAAGAQLNMDELMKGNASIILPEVDTDDCGDYSCEIIYSGEKKIVYMTLQIDETNWNCGSRRAKRDNRNSNFTIEGNGRKGVIIALFVWLSGVTFTAIMLWCKGACEEIDDILGVAICVCALLPWDHINAYILK